MADSPMERAVRALDATYSGPPTLRVDGFIQRLADLRTSDPEAFAAVLAECGVAGQFVISTNERDVLTTALDDLAEDDAERADDYEHQRRTDEALVLRQRSQAAAVMASRVDSLTLSEGQAVTEGRVVELAALVATFDAKSGEWRIRAEPVREPSTALYRVKPERSDRHTEDAS